MKKKTNKTDNFRKKILGLVISWKDPDPMSNDSIIADRKVSHINPVRAINIAGVTKGNSKMIFHEMTFKWKIEITGIFQYPNDTEQLETREIEAVCNINQIDEVANNQYLDIRKHGSDDAYVTTAFKVTCIGLS